MKKLLGRKATPQDDAARKAKSYLRQRYLMALESGKSVEDATAIANGAPRKREHRKLPPPPPALTAVVTASAAKTVVVEDISVVRAEYQRVVGKKPFAGWDIKTLRQRMTDAMLGKRS